MLTTFKLGGRDLFDCSPVSVAHDVFRIKNNPRNALDRVPVYLAGRTFA